jgi:hypothetical protein
MQHPTFSATLAEQHREQLHHHADLARVARDSRPKNRQWQWRTPAGSGQPPGQPGPEPPVPSTLRDEAAWGLAI